MKKGTSILTGIALVAFLVSISASAFAQARIVHKVEITEKTVGPSMGRDLWFTMAKNYDNQSGKYYELYVTSPNATTVNVQITGGTAIKRSIKPLEVFAFKIPLGWEVTSSGIVEDMAIRVWSNDADLTAYMLSRNPYTSDGMYIIPTIGWGTDYVVAAYHSLYEGFGTSYDYPSEFSLVANQDNTVCTILPSADIRKTAQPNEVLHKKGSTFTETLNRGQVVQYMLTLAENADDYDVTGSIVHSSKPIGLVGASQCPNIPPEYPYCDHICDMIPPVRTWAKTYYTIPFYNRKGGDSFLMIASQDGQTVYFNGVPVTTMNKYEHLFRPDIGDAGTWTSNAPFLLAQYINSTTWIDAGTGQDNGGIGDPAMVVVNSKEQYTPEVVFQTPTITTGTGYTHYANVIVNKDVATKSTLDGVTLNSYPSASPQQIPFSNYVAYRIRGLKSGSHHVVSDSGVGVYIYGYGSYDSYAWAGALGTRTFNDPDTIAPVVNPTGLCFDAHVDVADNHKAPPAAKILDIVLDSIYNMKYTPDPTFVSGALRENSFYDMSVIDPLKEAYLSVTTIDGAGNRSKVISTYSPMTAVLDPSLYNFGKGVKGTRQITYFTITNTGAVPYDLKDISLAFGDRGFLLDSADLTPPIPVGGSRKIRVSFEPIDQSTVDDTVMVSDGCTRMIALLLGNGGKPDFRVSGYDLSCELIGKTYYRNNVVIANTSDQPLNVIDIWVDDPVHFGYNKNSPASNQLPFTIPPGANKTIETTYMPNVVGGYSTTLHVKSQDAGEKTALLEECAIAPGGKTTKDEVQTTQCATDVNFSFTTTDTGGAPMTINQIVVTGDPAFGQPVQYTNVGGTNVTLPITLQPGELVNARVTFTAPPQASGTYKAQVFAISNTGDTTNSVTATVNAFYREAQVQKGTATIATVPYGSPKVTDFFTVCNRLNDPLTITGFTPDLTSPYLNNFQIIGYKVGGNNVTLPVTLAKDECLDVTVEFDPSKSTDAVQTLTFIPESDACVPTAGLQITAGTRLGPPTITGFSHPAIFSCETTIDSVPVTNPNFSGGLTFQNIQFNGGDAGFFTLVQPTPAVVGAGSSSNIFVQFNPAQAVAGRKYSTSIEATVRRPDNTDTTLIAQIDATANGMTAQVSSTFALADQSVKAGTQVKLPISLSVNKNGLNLPFDIVDVRRIEVVYTYNSDILDITNDDVLQAFSRGGLPNGWNIDPASNVVDGTNGASGKLTVILVGSGPMPDGITSLGEIAFHSALSKYGKSTDVTMESAKFFRANGSQIQGCFDITTQGTSTSLVYACGDATLVGMLNGQMPSVISPASPNPVTNHSDQVTLRYAIRYMSHVTLSIYDELGKEVKRLVDAHQHPAGAFEVRFDASTLGSGTYTYRLVMDGMASSGRFVVNY